MGYLGISGVRLGGEAKRGFGIDASAKNKFGGKGATNREDTLTGTISAIVTEVLPNGDLRVEGRREVTVNSERQIMTIGGIVRRVMSIRRILCNRVRSPMPRSNIPALAWWMTCNVRAGLSVYWIGFIRSDH